MGKTLGLTGFANGALRDRRFVMDEIAAGVGNAHKRIKEADGSRALIVGVVEAEAADGDRVEYFTEGTVFVRAGEANIPVRSYVTSDAEGRAVRAQPGDFVKAYFRGGKGFDISSKEEKDGPGSVGSFLEVELLESGFYLGTGGEEVVLRAHYDFAVQGSPDAADVELTDKDGNPVKVPAGAVIRSAVYHVETPALPNDGTTIGLFVGPSAAPLATLKAAIAINDASTPYAAGGHNGEVTEADAADMATVAADGNITIRASGPITAGKLMALVRFVLPEYPSA